MAIDTDTLEDLKERASYIKHHEKEGYEATDLSYLLKKLMPNRELKAPLQVFVPDTCVFSNGVPRFICSIGQISPFLKVLKLLKGRERLMLPEIRKFFQEKPEVLDQSELQDFKMAAGFTQDGRQLPTMRLSKKNLTIEKSYTLYSDHEIYDTIGDKSLVTYLMKQKGDLIWRTIKFIQRKVAEDSSFPEPIR